MWNVKWGGAGAGGVGGLVLIETLWNVKSEKYRIYETESYGINRNIVECKEIEQSFMYIWQFGINRNIVECKGITPGY